MKMSRNLKIKIAAIVAVALASVAVMGVLLFNMQNTLTQDNYAAEMVAEAEQLDTLLANAASEADQTRRRSTPSTSPRRKASPSWPTTTPATRPPTPRCASTGSSSASITC